ncbi:hypothetical protein QA811_01820 [Streptomyces sp. B21-102]|uniref:LexA family protein n=1 Tax=Streptomyces sp. B21-102 TaxID=3039416 RepID=UPI002FF0BD7F
MARPRSTHLTDLQERILGYIRQSIADRGEPPTFEEIGAEFGLRSRSAVAYQVEQMQAKGAIVREPHRARGIRLA